jgi:ADP-ribose pyrophosphatase
MNRKNGAIPENAKMVFKGELYEVWQWEQKMFDGSTAIFERLKRPDTVQIIAVIGDKIIIEDQEQPARAPFVSPPGGRIDPGEDSLVAAKRELLEETGYSSDDWTLWKEQCPSNTMEWDVYTYIARDCKKLQEPHLDAGEKIQIRLVDFEEFLMLSDDPHFRGKELIELLLRARIDPSEKARLHTVLFGA